jgi:hypothetical protein
LITALNLRLTVRNILRADSKGGKNDHEKTHSADETRNQTTDKARTSHRATDTENPKPAHRCHTTKTEKPKFTPEGLARISAGQKKRWAKFHATQASKKRGKT